MKILSILFALWASAVISPAGEAISIGEVARIPSKILGEERILLVSTPLGYGRGSERYPVLYMTDGGDHLVHVRGTADFLARNGLMPEVILVGVLNTDRTRDLTPTHGQGQRSDGSPVDLPTSGGASKFLDFFQQELFPFIEGRYRTAPCRIFLGHSDGGLLALHALVARPDCFNAFIAASPSLSWDGDYPLRKVAEFFSGRKAFPKTLYVTMAKEEAGAPRPNRFDRLRGTLSRVKAEGFSWEARGFPEESHGSVVLLSYYWGLQKVFEGWKLPLDSTTGQYQGSVKELEQHYAKIGKRLGYAFAPPEATVNLAGYQALGQKRLKNALALFRLNVEGHPGSPNVYDSLGEALEASGQPAEALPCYRKAVELGKATASPFLPVFQRNLDRVAAQLPTP